VNKSSSTVSGYAAMTRGQRLERFEYEPPELKEHDVRLAVTHCGLCYSDVHAIDDYFEITKFPFVPGHEIVGHVTEVGPSVTGMKVGDRVGTGWQGRSCMKCEWCLQGEEQMCERVAHNGVWEPFGGFASSISVDSRFAYPIPSEMPSEVAAVLLCAGITVYNPLRRYREDRPMKVGIVGIGGLGHLAIQFAHAMGYEVTAISSSPHKRDEAIGFGADHFVLAGDKETLRKQELTFDMHLYTAHSEVDWTTLSFTVRNNGRIVVVGFSTVPVKFEPLELVVHQQSISGSFLGSREMMREMLSFAQEHRIRPKVEMMPMAEVNEAIQRVKENKARYRIVLVN
jgi:uncharacterized zinc-type alcohol dehydrogenase-like protein